jgi:hypothetical protein
VITVLGQRCHHAIRATAFSADNNVKDRRAP